jgi:DNA-binding MarR family transcriptional regulator
MKQETLFSVPGGAMRCQHCGNDAHTSQQHEEEKKRFETARARKLDPETSKEAAASVNTTAMEELILYLLYKFGPSSTKELAMKSLRSRDSLSPRMKSLEQRGLVFRTAERRDKATVWALKEKQ